MKYYSVAGLIIHVEMEMSMKLKAVLLAILFAGPYVYGYDYTEAHPSFACPEYNQRFVDNSLASTPAPGHTYYVSVDGDDSCPGTSDEPFRTLEAARDAIRQLKKSDGLPKGGVHVVIMDGNYRLPETFELSDQDSGTPEAPIVYRGTGKEKVFLSGGMKIDTTGMAVVSEPATLNRLNPSAHGKVLSMKLPEVARSYFPGNGKYGMLSMDGYLLTLAQWPNRGYNHIKDIIEKGPTTRWLGPGEKPQPYSKENPTGGKFTFKEGLSPLVQAEFQRTGDMHAEGYFHNDWYFQNEPVGNVKEGVVQLLRYTRYGIENKIKSIPRRVRLVNVLAELDQPGEWYFDRIACELFVWPIKGFVPGKSKVYALGGEDIEESSLFHDYTAKVEVVKSGSALVKLAKTEYMTFRDITFENTGNQAIGIDGGRYNLIAGCTIRNGLNKGVTIAGGQYNGITGCDIYGLECAFNVTGGNFKTLERCYNFATNNDIHGCHRRGYGMVNLAGVGLYFAHNVIHDMNGAVNYKTVDALLEYNEFYNIGYEMGDFNVAYCGSLWYTMGNVVRFNFVHHLIEPGGHPVSAFRNDDGGAGLHLYGNVFYRPGRCAIQFHGPLNSFRNNITMDCAHMWWTNKSPITPEKIQAAWKDLEKFGRDLPHGDKGDNIWIMEQLMGKEGWKKSPWIDEFPELAKMVDTNPFAQTFGNVTNNYISGIKAPYHIHGGDGTVEGMESGEIGNNKDLPKNGKFEIPSRLSPQQAFLDVSKLDFSFKPDFKPVSGFKPIPFDKIGFVKDQFRPDPPKKEEYRAEVYRKFKDDNGGRYDADKVNARYPVPGYLK